MPRIEVALEVTVLGGVAVGQAVLGTRALREIARDAWGRPILPAAQVKGRLRGACAQVASTLCLSVCATDGGGVVPSGPRCAVCALFGAPAFSAALRWSDLGWLGDGSGGQAAEPGAAHHASDPIGGALALRGSRALSRARGTSLASEPHTLATTPLLFAAGTRFGHPRAAVGWLDETSQVQLLLAGCRVLTGFGGGTSRGLGWSTVHAEARADGVLVAFDPGSLTVQGRPDPASPSEAAAAVGEPINLEATGSLAGAEQGSDHFARTSDDPEAEV